MRPPEDLRVPAVQTLHLLGEGELREPKNIGGGDSFEKRLARPAVHPGYTTKERQHEHARNGELGAQHVSQRQPAQPDDNLHSLYSAGLDESVEQKQERYEGEHPGASLRGEHPH